LWNSTNQIKGLIKSPARCQNIQNFANSLWGHHFAMPKLVPVRKTVVTTEEFENKKVVTTSPQNPSRTEVSAKVVARWKRFDFLSSCLAHDFF
jgi:hypothetical protein